MTTASPELARIRARAESFMAAHLDRSRWSFAFDNAKTRAGQCDFARRRITLSRHLALRFSPAEIDQVIAHEVAHALAGPRAGHGPAWSAIARDLGYTGRRLHDGPIASDLAPWVGRCPAGHEHFRYRRPTRDMACALCSRRYDPAFAIAWHRREISGAA